MEILNLYGYNNFMKLQELITNKNLKLTNARREILEILINSNKPLSYEDVKEDISMDKATFYRNIIKFEENGLISTFESNDKKRYYEIQESEHSHFICNKCSKIECLHEQFNLKIENHKIDTIIIKGLCSNCINKS